MGRPRLEGTVCLVTGATGGIGRAVVTEFADAGADVIACGRDTRILAELGRDERVATLAVDLAQPRAGRRVATEALALRSHVDVLVNCAGVGLSGPVASLDDEELERLVTVNVTAPIELTRALLPQMLERGRGHVVNVGSILGRVGRRHEAAYSATKAALAVFSESLRTELHGTGVTVSLVSPGAVDTGFFARRGVPYGRRWPRPMAADRVAKVILRAVRSKSAEILVPRWLVLPVRFHAAAPSFFRLLARQFDRMPSDHASARDVVVDR